MGSGARLSRTCWRVCVRSPVATAALPLTAPGALHSLVVTAPLSPFCSPEEDPFLLLQSTLRCVERILQRSAGRPLRRSWLEFLYGEEEITLLEEELIPAIQQRPQRLDALMHWPPLAVLRGTVNQQAAAAMRQ